MLKPHKIDLAKLLLYIEYTNKYKQQYLNMTTENISFELEPCKNTSLPAESIESQENTELPNNLSEFGFTRYLYIIDDVKSSMVIAILERKQDEALFWAYELYFSGFKTDVFCILEQMVNMMYVPVNPRLGIFLGKKKQEWNETGSYCIVGTFIYNMIYRPYDISSFVIGFCKDPELIEYIEKNKQSLAKTTVTKIAKNIYINAEQKDVVKYITVNHTKSHNLLKKTVKYPIRKNTLAIFDHEHGIYTHETIQTLYKYHWLYYSRISPIWSERISKYGGHFNHDTHTVIFTADEQEELFFEKYNLEPDEQTPQIQEMNIGTGAEEQISWREFYEKYK